MPLVEREGDRYDRLLRRSARRPGMIGRAVDEAVVVVGVVEKDPRLRAAVDSLCRDLGVGSFVKVPHRDGDLLAVGLARPDNPDVLVYLSCDPDRDTFHVECEIPADDAGGLSYTVTRSGDNLDHPTVRTMVAEHLAPPP